MASGTDEKAKMEGLTSAAAFVEGGIQDACDDACSICLEAFCESDPSTLTGCKHEFHLQCILEWYNIDPSLCISLVKNSYISAVRCTLSV